MQSRSILDPQDLQYQLAHIEDSKVPQLLAAGVLYLVIAYTAVLLRFWSRHLSRTPLKADDYTICGSLILTTLYSAVLFALVRLGFGRHAILNKDPRSTVTLGLVSGLVYSVTFPVIKISTLLFLHRIFPGKSFSRKLQATGLVIAAYTIIQIVGLAIECLPLSVVWTIGIPLEGKCIKIKPILIVCASMNVVTDLVIFSLPIPKLWALQISAKHRLQLIVIFTLGAFVCIISTIRIPQLVVYSLFSDNTWRDVDFAIWSGFELAISTLSACLPTFRPLLDCLFGRRRLGTYATTATTRTAITPFVRTMAPGERSLRTMGTMTTRRDGVARMGEGKERRREGESAVGRGGRRKKSGEMGSRGEEYERREEEMLRPSSEMEPPGLWPGGGIRVETEWEVDVCEGGGGWRQGIPGVEAGDAQFWDRLRQGVECQART